MEDGVPGVSGVNVPLVVVEESEPGHGPVRILRPETEATIVWEIIRRKMIATPVVLIVEGINMLQLDLHLEITEEEIQVKEEQLSLDGDHGHLGQDVEQIVNNIG